MAKTERTLIVGVFTDRDKAQQAVNELRREGFGENQIGVAARDGKPVKGATKMKQDGTKVEEGAALGLATGAGVGALWGLGIVAGVLPAIGPAIAGGTLAAILSSAAAGAAAATLAGALIGLGIPEEDAKFYEEEFKAGRVIVTVKAGRRTTQAREILRRYGAYDVDTRSEATMATSRTARAGNAARGFKNRGTTTTPAAEAGTERTVDVKEEEVRVRKRPVKKGEVRIRKEVTVEPRTIEVPVTKEEVVVQRRRAGRRGASSNVGAEEIRIPVSEEQVHVEKRPVVTEEVTVGKRRVTGKRRVSTTARKEKVRVETEGNVRVQDDATGRR